MFRYLLPNKFKKIGWALILACPIFLIVFKDSFLSFKQEEDIASIMALIGLMMTIGSAEKEEDERTSLCRYKAIAIAFFMIISCTLTAKLLSLINFSGILSYIFSREFSYDTMLFNSPMGIIYFSAIIYHINFRGHLRDEK
jgi:hypothetical protein